MECAIRLENIWKRYRRDTLALEDVTLDIPKGASIAITGPSGCGKTTLINVIGQVLNPTSGRCYIEGRDRELLDQSSKAALRNAYFGYIVQEYALINEETVLENVMLPLIYSSNRTKKQQRKKLGMEVLAQLHLDEYAGHRASDLSGGQRQRVAIARAIINNPQVLLADEPTGALDSHNGEEVMDILLSLVREGKTLILVTHNQNLAQRCDIEVKMLDAKIKQVLTGGK